MSIQFASLNSGSNANCYYIGNENGSILIDAGLSCRETEKRMKRLGLSIDSINAIFISHEHVDHISGLEVLSRKYKIPVYITDATLRNSSLKIDSSLINPFKKNEPVTIGDLNIIPFSKSHDANDPHSFVIEQKSIHIGVITDIGYACKDVIKHFKQCDAVFLESNYCDEMLENGSYPRVLKKRISGRKGHLSNEQALELFLNHRAPHLQLLILSHLSENNNRPEIVDKLFTSKAMGVRVIVASRYNESEVFTIERSFAKRSFHTSLKPSENKKQLSLFDF